jgi:hypothetical protein
LPNKKQSLKAKIKSWQPIAAFVSSVALVAGGVGVFAYQQYTQAQISIAAEAESALTLGQQNLEDASEIVDLLEEVIREGEQVAVNAQDESLDEKHYEDFLEEIEKAKVLWVEKKARVFEIDAALQKLASLKDSTGKWDSKALAVARLIDEKFATDWSLVTSTISSLQQNASATQEKAAAAAAAKAAADNLARQSTEPTGIRILNPASDAAPCEVTPLESSPAKQSIENYVLGLASNTKTTWVCGICAPGTICGRALLPNLAALYPGFVGPPQNARDALVVVVLDENHIDFYLSQDGLSILVHEAAHARQHLKYGTLLLSSNAAYRGLPAGYTEAQAIAAVEYMADCATIVKLDRSTGAYTSSCTQSELEAAATIW